MISEPAGCAEPCDTASFHVERRWRPVNGPEHQTLNQIPSIAGEAKEQIIKRRKERGYGEIHVHSHNSAGRILRRPTPAVRECGAAGPHGQGYRNFANLAEGKAVCVMEGPTSDAIAAWFNKMGMPFDSITKVELEGDRGTVQSA